MKTSVSDCLGKRLQNRRESRYRGKLREHVARGGTYRIALNRLLIHTTGVLRAAERKSQCSKRNRERGNTRDQTQSLAFASSTPFRFASPISTSIDTFHDQASITILN